MAPFLSFSRLDPEQWRRISAVMDQAFDLPSEQVPTFLHQACAGDPELRAHVEGLLAADRMVGEQFLDALTIDLAAMVQDEIASLLMDHERVGRGEEPSTSPISAFADEGSPRFSAPERVGDRYLIRGLLGRGGMGEVYEAWDEELSIPVALKVLRLPGGREQEALQSLKREGLHARSVSHANVCRVYDLGRHGEGRGAVWFLTMELLRGETLAERLHRLGRLPLETALSLAEQMAAGLGSAHRAGVVHRDFKSSNVILVSEQGGEQAVVSDFGIARTAGTSRAAEEGTRLVGTPAYMAPEQVRGEDVGPAADIYAFGVVLYEMVTGRLPFTGGSAMELARRRLFEDPPSPRSVVPDLDEHWEAVILRCLARDPRRRFARAEQVADALMGRMATAAPDVGAREVEQPGRHTLPAERDAFVGREAEHQELDRAFSKGARLVTLLGAGGMGKTRLAVRYGWKRLADWPGGAWFCDLTQARSLDGIASAVAGSLGIALGRGDPIEQLGHAIAGHGRCLMILDNFEQVTDLGSGSLSRWMTRAPEACFLVTSRVRLGLGEAEIVQAVGPLSPEQGLELFLARARWLRPGLRLEGSEADSSREVVQLVEGMPIAIELAAARMRVMSASQIVAQMRKRFHLLTGGPSARHETLAAVIDGSWELLRPWERAALAQCAVFEGGFTLEAAEAVFDLGAWQQAPWVVDVLHSLIDKSLLRTWVPETGAGGPLPETRFGMYVSLQQYAREKLREEGAIPEGKSGAIAEQAALDRHGRWYARYGADERLDALDGQGGVEGRRALQRELENLMAACRRAVARGDGEVATVTYRAAWEVLRLCGPHAAAVELGREILGQRLGREDRGRALRVLGEAQWRTGSMDESRANLEAALAIAREVGDQRSELIALGNLGNVHFQQGRMAEARALYEAALRLSQVQGDRRGEAISLGCLGRALQAHGQMEEARAFLEKALAIDREMGDRRSEGIELGGLGMVHLGLGRMEDARAHFDAALAIHRDVGDRRSEGNVLGYLGILYLGQGRLDEARHHFEAALAIDREVGDRRFEAVVLGSLGIVHHGQGRKDEARSHYEGALAIHREIGDREIEAVVLGNLGNLHLEEDRTEEARAHYEAALAIAREMGHRRSEGITLGNLASLHLHRGQVEQVGELLARGEDLLREVGDRLELGKLLCVRAELDYRSGDIARARAALAEVELLVAQLSAGPDSELGRELAKLRGLIGRSSQETGQTHPDSRP